MDQAEEKAILQRQLKLLEEESQRAKGNELGWLTSSMLETVSCIERMDEKTNTQKISADYCQRIEHSLKSQKRYSKVQIVCLFGIVLNLIIYCVMNLL